MAKQTFEADGTVLGSREIEHFRKIPGFPTKVWDSYCYFCPRCGEVWGRLRHEGSTYWQCIYRACEKHGDGRLSLAYPAGQPLGVAVDWPRAALARELMVEIRIAEEGRY